jgi:hypothetical protein
MFKKTAIILFTFVLLFSSNSLFVKANDAKFVENENQISELCGLPGGSCFVVGETSSKDGVDSICDKGKCPIVESNTENQDSLDANSKSVSICNGPCPITGISNNYDFNSQSINSSLKPRSTTLTLATAVLRYFVFVITGLSFLVILGGLIATIFFRVKRKKFAITPFLVVVGGILFLVVSIICITIINLASFF